MRGRFVAGFIRVVAAGPFGRIEIYRSLRLTGLFTKCARVPELRPAGGSAISGRESSLELVFGSELQLAQLTRTGDASERGRIERHIRTISERPIGVVQSVESLEPD